MSDTKIVITFACNSAAAAEEVMTAAERHGLQIEKASIMPPPMEELALIGRALQNGEWLGTAALKDLDRRPRPRQVAEVLSEVLGQIRLGIRVFERHFCVLPQEQTEDQADE